MNALPSAESIALRLGANGDPKLNAAADFMARLLKSPIGSSVARVQLFGSVATGEVRAGSDVDVMVFAGADPELLTDAAAQAAWESCEAWGEQVAQLTYGLDELIQPRSYLVYHALRSGKEIYCMEDAEIRRMEAIVLVRKGRNLFEQAKRSAAQEDDELAVVGAYNAAELSAKAFLLLKPGVEFPGTHGGMFQTFSREYVKTGEVPARWAKIIGRGLEMRSRALYDARQMIDAEDARPILELAGAMLDELESRLTMS